MQATRSVRLSKRAEAGPAPTLVVDVSVLAGERTMPMAYADWKEHHDPMDRAVLDEWEESVDKSPTVQ